MKKLIAMLMALAMVLTMAACGSQNTDNEPKNNEDGFDYSSLTIAGIVFQNDEFCRILQQGYEAAAKEYGVNLLLGNSNDSVDKEIELVNTFPLIFMPVKFWALLVCLAPAAARLSVPFSVLIQMETAWWKCLERSLPTAHLKA